MEQYLIGPVPIVHCALHKTEGTALLSLDKRPVPMSDIRGLPPFDLLATTGSLAARWVSLCDRLGVSRASCSKAQRFLFEHYAEPLRRYHTLQHLEEMFSYFDEPGTAQLLVKPDHVSLAIFYHDAIYDGVNTADENASAACLLDFAREIGTESMTTADAEEIARWIRLTATHRVDATECMDCKLFMDMDMAILGQPWAVFEDYYLRVKTEYEGLKKMPPVLWTALWSMGRPNAMASLLAGPPIYATDRFRARFESAARENLAREMRVWWAVRRRTFAMVAAALLCVVGAGVAWWRG